MTTPEGRLDRIESILEHYIEASSRQNASLGSKIDSYIQTSTVQISSMTNSIEALSRRVDNYIDVASTQNGNLTRTVETLINNVVELIYKVDDFIGTSTTVLARSALLDDLVVGLHEITTRLDTNFVVLQNNLVTLQSNSENHQRNFELHQREFDENQRSTNAALERLEAILMKLSEGRDGGGIQ